MTLTASEVFRDYVTDGVPASGANQVSKRDARALFALYESLLNSSASGLGYPTLAQLNADLARGPNTLAIVYNDATPANNGQYQKTGASGSGAWVRIGDLPKDLLRLTDLGTGTANAITASAVESPTAPANKLYLLLPIAANTGPTTISVNGRAAVPIKNAFGVDLAADSLLPGSPVLMTWAVDHYQLVVSANVDASAILAASQAAALAAEESADTAVAAAGSLIVNFETISAARAFSIPSGVKYFRTAGRAAPDDGGGALYTKMVSAPSTVKAWHEQTADGASWILLPRPVLRPEMFDGGDPNVSTDCGPALRNCRDYIAALGGGVLDLGQKQDTYIVGTLRGDGVVFEPTSNMTIQGHGTIKIANGVYSGGTCHAIWAVDFFNDRSDNFTCKDFTLDMNGQNNLSSGYTTQIGFGVGDNITIDNVTFLNMPGSQGIVLGQHGEPPTIQGARITNNVFMESGWNVNSSTTDHSSIYFNGDGVVCTGNRLLNSSGPPHTAGIGTTAIECHGTNWVVSGNTVDGYERLGNIAAEVGNAINCVFSNNVGRNLRAGIILYSASGFVMDQISICGNKLRLLSMDMVSAGIDATGSLASGANHIAIDICDNHITDGEPSASAASIFPGISCSYFKIMNIHRNTLNALSGAGIEIGPLNTNTNLEILDNKIIDCGRTSDATYKKGIKVLQTSSPKTIKIGRNTIVNTSTQFMTHGVHVLLTSVAGGKVYEDDVIVNVATPYSISAPGVTTGPGL